MSAAVYGVSRPHNSPIMNKIQDEGGSLALKVLQIKIIVNL